MDMGAAVHSGSVTGALLIWSLCHHVGGDDVGMMTPALEPMVLLAAGVGRNAAVAICRVPCSSRKLPSHGLSPSASGVTKGVTSGSIRRYNRLTAVRGPKPATVHELTERYRPDSRTQSRRGHFPFTAVSERRTRCFGRSSANSC